MVMTKKEGQADAKKIAEDEERKVEICVTYRRKSFMLKKFVGCQSDYLEWFERTGWSAQDEPQDDGAA